MADDQFLVSFLRGSKYDMNLAKQKVDLFFTMRTMMPEITENREIRYGKTAEIMKLGLDSQIVGCFLVLQNSEKY